MINIIWNRIKKKESVEKGLAFAATIEHQLKTECYQSRNSSDFKLECVKMFLR